MRNRRISPLKAALFWGVVAWLLIALFWVGIAHADWGYNRSPANASLCHAYSLPSDGIEEARLAVSYHGRWRRWALSVDFLADPSSYEQFSAIEGQPVVLSLRFEDGSFFRDTWNISLNGKMVTLIGVPEDVIHDFTTNENVDLYLHHELGAALLGRYDLKLADEAIANAYACAIEGEQL